MKAGDKMPGIEVHEQFDTWSLEFTNKRGGVVLGSRNFLCITLTEAELKELAAEIKLQLDAKEASCQPAN